MKAIAALGVMLVDCASKAIVLTCETSPSQTTKPSLARSTVSPAAGLRGADASEARRFRAAS
jgi:hypothetical protein